MFKKFTAALAVAAGVFAGTGLASAADLGAVPYNKTPAYITPVYDWSGAYAGVNVGYGWGRSSDTSTLGTPPVFTDSVNARMNGVSGGAQIGYNLQMQNWLVGLEGDIQATGQSNSHSYTCAAGVCTTTLLGGIFPIPGPAVSATETQRIDFFGTVRGRVGLVVVPTVLLYATGGLAYGQVDADSTLSGATRSQNYKLGWTAGGGIEGAIGGGWTARLEYLYLDLGKVSGTFTSNLADPTGTTALVGGFSSRITDNILRVGVNYRFGDPVIAKY
ncbi:outer membrane beta-barrel protein [Bradyrhizobium sp. dw_411]|uniref:outer membrane protein n=1 Tax=Bradyrhizobium sp. dw_411 TaxID=2720082 RepID=UPI001BCDE519|nr:outer membrane beta-barrel protein [Bradyrhizobium sp. dw_411]